jgi:hypothetical protein
LNLFSDGNAKPLTSNATPEAIRSSIPATLTSILSVFWALLLPIALPAEPVIVRHVEGFAHGFLVLRSLDGTLLADGDLIQAAQGSRVTDHLLFHFKDGSAYDETFVFTQRGVFQLLTDHLVMKGPAFKQPVDMSIDASTGRVTSHYTDAHGHEKIVTERLKVSPDLANGMLPILLKNLPPDSPRTTLSMVLATPSPRLVNLSIVRAGEERFTVGGSNREALHYVVKVEIGGVAGAIAPLVDKEPPDTNLWVLGGQAPAFLRSEGVLFSGGPIWRIELACPVFTDSSSTR